MIQNGIEMRILLQALIFSASLTNVSAKLFSIIGGMIITTSIATKSDPAQPHGSPNTLNIISHMTNDSKIDRAKPLKE